MATKPKARILEHVHGLLAGSLLVLALFLASAIPLTLWAIVRGQITLGSVLTLVGFLALLAAGVREARTWKEHLAMAGEA